MSNIIDSSGLSKPVFDIISAAMSVDNHRTRGDISVTQLIDAPQIRMLKRKHKFEEELSDRLFMLLGTALHHILEMTNVKSEDHRAMKQVIDFFHRQSKVEGPHSERFKNVEKFLNEICNEYFKADDSPLLFEQTLFFEIDGMTISMTFDLYDKINKTLMDYKLTSSWSVIYPESKLKWSAQQNVYAYGLRKHGFEVNESKIVAIIKDWSKSKANDRSYPQGPIVEIPIELYSQESMEDYLKGRVKLHKLAESGTQVDCTAKEMWAKSDTYAIKTAGRKTAVKLFDSKPMADAFIRDQSHKYPKGLTIELRPGGRMRCEEYCPVKSVCPQYKEYINQLSKSE